MRTWRWAALLLASVLLLRAAGLVFGVVDNDETDFLLVGKLMSAGKLPYVDAFDHKPLLLYLLFVPSAALTWQIWPMQLVAVVFLTATCLVLARAATEWTGTRAAGVAAAIGCALASTSNVVSVNAELLLNLPASLALWCFIRAGDKPRYVFACGLAIGCASLIKHQAGILLVALVLAELPRAPSRALPMTLGFVLPWLAAIVPYALHGRLAAFYDWNLTRNVDYSVHTFGSPLLRALVGVVGYAFGTAPLWWTLALRRARPRAGAGRVRAGLLWTLWLTWIPVSLGGRFYIHYYLQFVPPLCLLAARPAAALWRMRARLPATRRRAAFVALLLPVLTVQTVHVARGLLHQYPSQEPHTRAIAAWLRAHTRTDERVVVYGHFTPLYQEAERLPGTRYIHTSSLFGNVDAMQLPAGVDAARLRSPADEAAFIADLARGDAAWLVDTAPADIKRWSKLPLAALPSLAGYVAANFEKVASPGGATVYRRLSRPRRACAARSTGAAPSDRAASAAASPP